MENNNMLKLKGQKVWKITHNPEYTKLVFVVSNKGLVYNPENPISTHSTLFTDFANQIGSLYLDGRVAEYEGKTIVQFYGTYSNLTIAERALMKYGLKEMLSKGFITGGTYVVDGTDTIIDQVHSIRSIKKLR